MAATTRTKRKSKRRKAKPAAEPGPRPKFADAYPRDAELDELVVAFAKGNYARIRADADALADRTDDDNVRDAALDLRRRINPEPTAMYMLGIGVALVIVLYAYYLMHQ